MTDEETENELVLSAEKLAAALPLKEPDWDALEKRVTESLAKVPAVDEALFAAPLPATVGDVAAAAVTSIRPGSDPAPAVSKSEAVAMASGVAAEKSAAASAEKSEGADVEKRAGDTGPLPKREPVSLADLARSVTKRGDAETSSIAKESLALASQHRAQGEEVVERVQASSRQAITIPPSRTSAQGDVRILWVGLGIAAVGLAAGFALYLKGARETQPVIISQAAPVQAGPTPEPRGAATPGPVAASRPAEDGPRGISPEALAGEVAAGPGAAQAPSPAVGRTTAGAQPITTSPGGLAAASGLAKAVRPERVVLEEDRAAAAAPKPTPAPAPSAPLKPAELNRDSGSGDRPSAGAAQAAVGAVLGAARSCLAGHPQPSSATLVFDSSGQVSSVSVGGPAAGTPAAGCIETALKKARVQPFAAPTFSLAVTVRPP